MAVVALAAATHLLALRNDLGYMRDVSFRFDAQSQGLSPDEAQLFERAAEELPEGSLVIGDPLTGAGLLFAYTGDDVVFPHVTGRYGRDAAVLARYFVDGGPEVCDAAERLGVTHAVDFGDTVLYQNHYTTYDGLHDLDDSPILTEVDRVGTRSSTRSRVATSVLLDLGGLQECDLPREERELTLQGDVAPVLRVHERQEHDDQAVEDEIGASTHAHEAGQPAQPLGKSTDRTATTTNRPMRSRRIARWLSAPVRRIMKTARTMIAAMSRNWIHMISAPPGRRGCSRS